MGYEARDRTTCILVGVQQCILRRILSCMAATVRIEEGTHKALGEIAKAKGITMQAALSRAVETYRRAVFLEGLADDFARLRADPKAWAQEQAERGQWDQTLADGDDE